MKQVDCPNCINRHVYDEDELEGLASARCACGQDLIPLIFPPAPRRPFSIRPIFAWYDLWVGAYWDRQERRLFIFPVPMLGVVLEF